MVSCCWRSHRRDAHFILLVQNWLSKFVCSCSPQITAANAKSVTRDKKHLSTSKCNFRAIYKKKKKKEKNGWNWFARCSDNLVQKKDDNVLNLIDIHIVCPSGTAVLCLKHKKASWHKTQLRQKHINQEKEKKWYLTPTVLLLLQLHLQVFNHRNLDKQRCFGVFSVVTAASVNFLCLVMSRTAGVKAAAR